MTMKSYTASFICVCPKTAPPSVPSRARESGVRGAVVWPAVRLDFDDTSDAQPDLIVADQAYAEECSGRVGCGSGEDPPVEDVQDFGYIASILSGTRNPKSVKKSGISVARKKSTIWELSRNVQKSRRNCSSVSRGGALSR